MSAIQLFLQFVFVVQFLFLLEFGVIQLEFGVIQLEFEFRVIEFEFGVFQFKFRVLRLVLFTLTSAPAGPTDG